jgi:peptidoglycan/xylan/chitin deacetylase (PgdA/CDA1 family)
VSLAVASLAALVLATPAAGQVPRRVVFTYDDLPANIYRGDVATMREVTDGLLAGLRRHRIPAIGFVNESKLFTDGTLEDARVALLRAWLEGGLELGNHSYSHPDINTTPLDEYEADVLRGERVTRALLAESGLEPRYFRHPFLHTGLDPETRSAFESFLKEHGYRIAPVTIDNQEWIFARAYDHAHVRGDAELKGRIATEYVAYMDSIFGYYEGQSRALLGYELPQVLLLHANRLNADAMDPLVSALRARGYEFVTLDEALEDDAYGLPDEYVGRAGITWLHRWALTQGKRGEFFAGEPGVPSFVREAYDDPPDR